MAYFTHHIQYLFDMHISNVFVFCIHTNLYMIEYWYLAIFFEHLHVIIFVIENSCILTPCIFFFHEDTIINCVYTDLAAAAGKNPSMNDRILGHATCIFFLWHIIMKITFQGHHFRLEVAEVVDPSSGRSQPWSCSSSFRPYAICVTGQVLISSTLEICLFVFGQEVCSDAG